MKQTRHLHALLLALALAFSTLPAARAQDAAPPAPETAAAADAPPPQADKTLWGLFLVGGWTMWPLLACSIAGIGLVIYNVRNLRPAKFRRPDVFAQIRDSLQHWDVPGAKGICEANPCPIANIVHAGIDRITSQHADIDSIEKGMEEAATEEITNHMFPINYLSIIAVIAPMIGLLGTVSGMIKAFSNMATLGMGRPERLADNISEALITTASGLIVGIPVMVAYFYFKNRYMAHVAALNRMAGEMVEHLKKALRGEFEVPAGEHADLAHAMAAPAPEPYAAPLPDQQPPA